MLLQHIERVEEALAGGQIGTEDFSSVAFEVFAVFEGLLKAGHVRVGETEWIEPEAGHVEIVAAEIGRGGRGRADGAFEHVDVFARVDDLALADDFVGKVNAKDRAGIDLVLEDRGLHGDHVLWQIGGLEQEGGDDAVVIVAFPQTSDAAHKRMDAVIWVGQIERVAVCVADAIVGECV